MVAIMQLWGGRTPMVHSLCTTHTELGVAPVSPTGPVLVTSPDHLFGPDLHPWAEWGLSLSFLTAPSLSPGRATPRTTRTRTSARETQTEQRQVSAGLRLGAAAVPALRCPQHPGGPSPAGALPAAWRLSPAAGPASARGLWEKQKGLCRLLWPDRVLQGLGRLGGDVLLWNSSTDHW